MKKIIILFTLGFLSAFGISLVLAKGNEKRIVSVRQQPHKVKLIASRAIPSELIIKKGEEVQFDAGDGRAHSLEEGQGDGYGGDHLHRAGSLRSGTFQKDEGWRIKLDKGGTYNFHDHLNPKIFITVFVYDPTKK